MNAANVGLAMNAALARDMAVLDWARKAPAPKPKPKQ